MHHFVERRIAQLSPGLYLVFVQGPVVLRRRGLDGVVLGVVGLDDDLPGGLTPARAAGYLAKQAKSPLSGPEIGQIKTDVSQHHSHQSNVGYVQSLGHHLGAHQYLGVAAGQAGHDVFGVLA